MSSSTPSSSKLAQFSTCEISDALIKLGLSHGGHLPDLYMMSPSPAHSTNDGTRLCGPAYTVQMVLSSNTTAPRLSSHFVDTATEGSVIVIDAPLHAKNAVWGGLMTAGAISRAALGVIISGRCRDLREHRESSFPVFARGHSTLGQSPFTRPSAINVPLKIGIDGDLPAVVVKPGDYMVADEDGVVCVPSDMISKVVELAATGRHIDTRCMDDIKNGNGIQETFKKHRGR